MFFKPTLLGVAITSALALPPQPAHSQTRSVPVRAGFVRVADARIHVLEWAGGGPTVVLLPGYSLTAHVFGEIGGQLASRHRVVAITPRGFGESDAPDSSAYTIATLVSDLRAVLDSLHIDRAVLVGHSLSGTVIAHFALAYPNRVRQLVFLDAFPYFNAEGDSIETLDPIAVPAFEGDTTYDAVAAYLARYRFVPWRPALDADLRVKPLGAEGERRRRLTAHYIEDQWATEPDLTKLRVPSVEVCATPSVASEYPWLRRGTPDYRRAETFVAKTLRPFAERLCSRFARTVPGARVVRVPGSHYLFFT
ncbi:MAG: alpha/beta hydrolase, partial [Gemmatimonadaceae bacterium]